MRFLYGPPFIERGERGKWRGEGGRWKGAGGKRLRRKPQHLRPERCSQRSTLSHPFSGCLRRLREDQGCSSICGMRDAARRPNRAIHELPLRLGIDDMRGVCPVAWQRPCDGPNPLI